MDYPTRVVQHDILLRFLLPPEFEVSVFTEDRLTRSVEQLPALQTKHKEFSGCYFNVYQIERDVVTIDDILGVMDEDSVMVLTIGRGCEISLTPEECQTSEQIDAKTAVQAIQSLVAEIIPSLTYIQSHEYKEFKSASQNILPF